MIAEWCWELLVSYLTRLLQRRGVERPGKRDLLEEFARVWPGFTATIG